MDIKTNQQVFDAKEKEVLRHLKQIHEDIEESLKVLGGDKPHLIKSRLCMAFIAADTFSRFYAVLIGDEELASKNRDRFRFWIGKFVLTEKNEVFEKYKDELKCDSLELWDLRNSLVHFYGLPKDGNIILGGGVPKDSKTFQVIQAAMKRMKKKYKTVNPYCLIRAIMTGLLVQLLDMIEILKNQPKQYIEGINKCHGIFMREGTHFINKDEFD